MSALLLDTCAFIWTAEGAPMDRGARAAMASSYADGRPVLVSPISSWEIGLLFARGRLRLVTDPQAWFRNAIEVGGTAIATLSAELLIASSLLPGTPPRDPADRVVIATARAQELTIVTRDRRILAYADEGYVKALPC